MAVSFTVIIPARYASHRLPGKPLLDIHGKTMIERVYIQACKSSAQRVVIATDDERIVAVCKELGAEVCLTAVDHPSGTDRIDEVCRMLTLEQDHIVVNVQGDEPCIPPAVIDQVANNLYQNSSSASATLSMPINSQDEFINPNTVKVVASRSGKALYFSRAAMPWPRASGGVFSATPAHRHVGIYAYRVSTLAQFVQWPVSVLEQVESLEQLRLLDNDLTIHVEPACEPVPHGIDTQQDLNQLLKDMP